MRSQSVLLLTAVLCRAVPLFLSLAGKETSSVDMNALEHRTQEGSSGNWSRWPSLLDLAAVHSGKHCLFSVIGRLMFVKLQCWWGAAWGAAIFTFQHQHRIKCLGMKDHELYSAGAEVRNRTSKP